MGGQKMRTREIKGAGKNPKWDQVFWLTVKDLEEAMTVAVYDEDIVSRDHVGRTMILLAAIQDQDEWYTI